MSDNNFLARTRVLAARQAIESRAKLSDAMRALQDCNYRLADDLITVKDTPLWQPTLDAINLTDEQAHAIIAWRLMLKGSGPVLL